jgi:hypothetical protein
MRQARCSFLSKIMDSKTGNVPPPRLSFGTLTPLQIAFGSMQGVKIWLEDFDADGTTRDFRASLTYEWFDHYGADDNTITPDHRFSRHARAGLPVDHATGGSASSSSVRAKGRISGGSQRQVLSGNREEPGFDRSLVSSPRKSTERAKQRAHGGLAPKAFGARPINPVWGDGRSVQPDECQLNLPGVIPNRTRHDMSWIRHRGGFQFGVNSEQL